MVHIKNESKLKNIQFIYISGSAKDGRLISFTCKCTLKTKLLLQMALNIINHHNYNLYEYQFIKQEMHFLRLNKINKK